MPHTNHLARGQLLLEQSRYPEAEREFRQALAQEPNHAGAHALLALCLIERNQNAEATGEAQQAIHLDPEEWFGYYVLSLVYSHRNQQDEALKAVRAAIVLAPTSAVLWATQAAVLFDQGQWQAALESAETGLQHDAEDVRCANLRAMALVKLGRKKEAESVIAEALRNEPDNPFSHANQGWAMLEQRRIREAKDHFREALRLDPILDLARAGMLEALKAGNPAYRLLLSYFLWMAKLSPGARWGVVIGLYVAFRVLRNVSREMPDAAPYVFPLLAAYLVFALFSWLGVPVFNLVLRLNRYGRYLLSPDQTKGANLIGLCLAAGLLSGLAGILLNPLWILVALGFGVLMIPASAIFNCSAGWPRYAMAAITAGLAVLGLIALVGTLTVGGESCAGLGGIFALGCVLSTWPANWLTSAEVTH
jgi:tetratricopeptide (TPR) repeat protein